MKWIEEWILIIGLFFDAESVVTCARDPAKLKQLEAQYAEVEYHPADLSDASWVRTFSNAVLSAHPRIDLLIV